MFIHFQKLLASADSIHLLKFAADMKEKGDEPEVDISVAKQITPVLTSAGSIDAALISRIVCSWRKDGFLP